MNLLIAAVIVAVVCSYVAIVHSYYRKQARFCATFPYYGLRDKVIWEMLADSDRASERERLYGTLNKIVHHADEFGWKFISNAVIVATHAFLDQTDLRNKRPSALEIELADLLIASAKQNSLAVRMAFTRFGRILLLYPMTKAGYEHFQKTSPRHFEAIKSRIETLRGVRRLDAWRHSGGLAPA